MSGFEDEYGPETYGDRIAHVYDARPGEEPRIAEPDEVEFLAKLAGPGPVLELGIGT